MTTNTSYDLLCIGNYTKDTIISPAGTRYVDGGAVNYAAHATARLGVKTAVVTRLAAEDSRVVEKFAQAGVDCFAVYTPHSTLMKLEYPTTDPDIRRLSVAATAGSITSEQVAGLQVKAAVIGSSLRGEVGLDVIQALKGKGVLVAVDMQGFVRVLRGEELRYEPWEEMRITLAQVDIVKSDAVEAEFLTGKTDIRKAAQFFTAMGPKEIVLTHKDGVLVYTGGKFTDVGFFSARMNGRSGRGDTCIGVYTAMRLSKTPGEAGIWAAAVTSLKMEDLGPFKRSIADVEALIHAKYNHKSIH
jgi:sugar/nucleoside kinase (ribokinase family)